MALNSETIIAFIRLCLGLVAGVAASFGWALEIDLWQNIIISVAAVLLFIWIWWRNNNVTEAAQEAQRVLDELKCTEDIKPGGTDGD